MHTCRYPYKVSYPYKASPNLSACPISNAPTCIRGHVQRAADAAHAYVRTNPVPLIVKTSS
jgi:hypothetical protein